MSTQNVATTPLGSITDCLLVQVDDTDAIAMADMTNTGSGGMVVTGAGALTVLKHLRATGYTAPLLPDRQRYSGTKRLNGIHPFDPNWIGQQQRLGSQLVMPDAGYVPAQDLSALRSILDRSAAIPNGVALLALAKWWIHTDGLGQLMEELTGYPAPVALVLEDKGDPYTALRNLRGVVSLLEAGVALVPLRSDQSALGLIAFGAVAAGIGARSALRHLYPSKTGFVPPPTGEGTFWPIGLSFHSSSHLHDAAHASPQNLDWLCDCGICRGQRLDRLDSSSVYEIREHNHACMTQLRDELTEAPTSARPDLWLQKCKQAIDAHAVVDAGPVSLPTPRTLANWLRL